MPVSHKSPTNHPQATATPNLAGYPLQRIGNYLLITLPNNKTSIVDTRTHEGGAFDTDAVHTALNDALDTFFTENF